MESGTDQPAKDGVRKSEVITKTHQCVFCDKTFTRRSWYDKHECTKKKRFAEVNNLDTIRAQQLFAFWQRRVGVKRKLSQTPMTEFLNSSFYGTFKKLSEFSTRVGIVSAFKYLEWLIQNKVRERYWTNLKNLNEFREYTRQQETPADQVDQSFRNIRAWCTMNENIPIKDFFSRIEPSVALAMVRQNRLMPWVLLGYSRAVTELLNRFGHEHLVVLDEFINLEHWLTKIEAHPDLRALVESLSEEQVNASPGH